MLRMITLEMDQIEEIQRELNGGAINLEDIENRQILISMLIILKETMILSIIKIGTVVTSIFILDLTRRTESWRS